MWSKRYAPNTPRSGPRFTAASEIVSTQVTCITEHTVDDLMRVALELLIGSGKRISPSRGPALEVRGVRLELTNPRARLSRSRGRGKVVSCLGEFVWYVSGSADVEQVAYYIPRYRQEAEPDGTVQAAYGTRLFGDDGRLDALTETLKTRTDSRQAVIQLLEPGDLTGRRQHVPCTCTLQFFKRDAVVDMVVFMRSNDAYLGLPHDVFAFTMLQELVARSVGAEPGTYVHMVGSLHVYDEHRGKASAFLEEGWGSPTAMPPMPLGDPTPHLAALVEMEASIRTGTPVDLSKVTDPYWADITRLLAVHGLARRGADPSSISALRREMNSRVYDVFLNDRFDILEDD